MGKNQNPIRDRARSSPETNQHRVRIAVVGLGEVSTVHLQALRNTPIAELVAVCDMNSAIASKVADQENVKAFSDAKDMLTACKPDLLMILTPAATHRALVELAAAAKIDVFCEKPLSIGLEDAQAIVTICQNADVRCFYGSSYRYLPAIRKARDLIQSGAIGHVQLMSEMVVAGQGLAGYRPMPFSHYPEGGPGGPPMSLIDHGIHLVDIFSWWLDEKANQVLGHGLKSGDAAGTEFLISKYPSGATGHLLYNNATFSTGLPNEGMFAGGAGWGNDGQFVEAGGWINDPGCINVWGTKGALRIFHYANAVFMTNAAGQERVELEGKAPPAHFTTQLEACVQCLLEGRDPEISAQEGVTALSLVLATTGALGETSKISD